MIKIKSIWKRKIITGFFKFLGIVCFPMFFFGFVFGFFNKNIENFLSHGHLDGYLGVIAFLCWCLYFYCFLAPLVEDVFEKSEQNHDSKKL
jgi:hypothetical protein